MLHNVASQRPTPLVTWAAVGFLAGVLVHAIRPYDRVGWLVLGGLTVASWVASRLPFRVGKAVAAFLLFAAVGVWRFDATLPGHGDDLMDRAGDRVELVGRITDVRRYDAVLSVDAIDGRPIRSRSRVAFGSGRGTRVGERVRVDCTMSRLNAEAPQAAFDARQGVFVRCRGAVSVTRFAGPAAWDLRAVLSRWREAISRRIRSVLPGDEGALLAGILYGERGLSKEANESFRNAGMTHLIAVSGSNITLVVGLLVPFFLAFGYRRNAAIVLAGFGVTIFVLFVGAQASVVRAALMGWFALLARTFGRKADAARLLAIAATAIVLFDPWALAFDAGFALSFLATWGLIAWARPIAERLPWIPETFGLREIIATTVAATAVTTPYSLWAFERTSLAGLVTNLFAIPLVGLTMLWGAVAVVLAPSLPVAALPVQGCLRVMLGIARIADRLPWLRLAVSLPTWGFLFVHAAMMFVSARNRATKTDYPHEPTAQVEKHPFMRAFVRPL